MKWDVTQRKQGVRRVNQRRKQFKSLHVRIPLAKLNNMLQCAGVQHASAPVFRKTIQVTSCTKIMPLKQSDDLKMELDGYKKSIDCLSADTLRPAAQRSSSNTSSATVLLKVCG